MSRVKRDVRDYGKPGCKWCGGQGYYRIHSYLSLPPRKVYGEGGTVETCICAIRRHAKAVSR